MNVQNVSDEELKIVKSMNRTENEELKRQILQADPTAVFGKAKESNKADKCYINCPSCGNGTRHDHTPVDVTFTGDRWSYHCWTCGDLDGDLLSIIAKAHSLDLSKRDDMCKALAIGANLIGYNLYTHQFNDKPPTINSGDNGSKNNGGDKSAQLPLIQADIRDAQLHLGDLPDNARRGLTIKTLRHFGFGFLQKWLHPQFRFDDYKGYIPPPSRRIIIPTENHYNAVALPADRQGMKKDYWKQHAGKKNLFNPDALAGDLILVVEGEIDAASIWQAFDGNVSVCAILGINNWKATLLPKLDGLNGKKFLILLDKDDRNNNAADLRQELIKRGYRAAYRYYYDALLNRIQNQLKIPFEFDNKIDANQILQSADEYFLRTLTQDIINDAQTEFNAVAAQVDNDKILNEKIAEWGEDNGAINHLVADKLKKAKAWLDSLTPETINSANGQSSKTKRAIALCRFYDCFADSADRFLANLENAKSKAAVEVKKAEALASEPAIEHQMLLQVSIRDLKADVNKIITEIKKAHTQFQKDEEVRLAHERNKKIKAEFEALYKSNTERLQELQAEDKSPERDAEIIEILKQMCEWAHDKHGEPVAVKATAANLKLIFNYDPNIQQLFGFDEFQEAPVFLRQAIWRKNPCTRQEWTDSDDSELRVYLRETYPELANKELIYDYFTSYANKHSFHVVKESFKKLPKWDGTPRADEYFIKHLQVPDTPYARAVTRNWLIAAVARIFNPGCRYQTALVLHGKQGIGKSYSLERLGGSFYNAITDRVDDPHAADALKLIWIGEFKEMAGMRKAEINAIKQFIELSHDTRRFAYMRRARSVPRHCVFAITVNDEKFLADKTGNRRYLILHCGNEQGHYIPGLTDEYIQQLWAEVYAIYQEMFKDGFDEHKLELNQEFRMQAEELTKQHVSDDGLDGQIQAFVDEKILPKPIWDNLTIEERADFHKNGCLKLLEAQSDLNHRLRAKGGRNVQDKINELDSIFRHTKNLFVTYEVKRGTEILKEYWLYGTEYRQHICAKEIANECLGDKKAMTRVHEILSQLDGWAVGKRIIDSKYGDQKTVYYRNSDNNPDDNDNHNNNPDSNNAIKSDTSHNQSDDYFRAESFNSENLPFDPNDLPI